MGKVLALLSNNFKLAATTIAAIYKERWPIELFFNALKQNLRIKTFVGTSPNDRSQGASRTRKNPVPPAPVGNAREV